MRPDEADAMIEKLLSEQDEYIADNGFTRRVVSSLPAAGLSGAVRLSILGVFATAALAVVCFATPAGAVVIKALLVTLQSLGALQAPPVWAVVALAVVGFGSVGLARLETQTENPAQ